jgi:hypothetical protein
MTSLPSRPEASAARRAPARYAQFHYDGAAVLLVRGPSGRTYRFTPGSTVAVEGEDAASLARVHQLRRMR